MSKRTIIYIALTLLVALLISCDSRVGSPDIRDENHDKKPDYFGWKWDWKW